MNIEELHNKIIYSVVRVKTAKAGGSGTVIYSQPDPTKTNEYLSLVMTCAHVVEDAIEIKKDWDSVLKKHIEKEFVQQVGVEIFDYVDLSTVNSSYTLRADIVSYDKNGDIAILKLNSPRKIEYVASLIPKDKINNVKFFMPTLTCGCSLSHTPFANAGYITGLTEMIDNKLYWMCNGASIFGNSGGAVFLAETGEQLGITARITTLQLGFGVDVITWMGFMVAPQRIYNFFEQQELKFLYDPSDTYEKAMKRREKKEKASRLAQKAAEEEEVAQEITS